MSMVMSFEDLVELGNLIGELDAESRLKVKVVSYKDHDIYLDHDERGYKVKGITDKQQGMTVLREQPVTLGAPHRRGR